MESELRDSSEILGDWAVLRERIAEDGYVFVRGLLDPELVRAVGRRGLGALQAAGWTEPGGDPVTAAPVAPVRAVRMRDAFGQPGYRDIVRDPGFNSLAFTEPVVSLMAQILGPEGFCYPVKVPRVVYPTTFAPHQPGNYTHKDYNAVQDMFTCWVPLGEIPFSLGGLALEPGSQHSARIRRSLPRSRGRAPPSAIRPARPCRREIPTGRRDGPRRRAGLPLPHHPRRAAQP